MPLTPFTPIQNPYMHGVESSRGHRHAQVVRAYPNDWRVFAKIHGRHIKPCEEIKATYPTKAAALKDARRFLGGDFTPTTW